MLKELNLSFIWTTLLHDSMNWTFLNLTRRVESFPIWLKELDFFLNMTRRIEPFLPWLERIEPLSFFEYDSKTWTFVWVWLKEVSLFFWTWLKELNLFLNLTQRMDPFSQNDSENWTFFSKCVSKNGTFFQMWLKELNLFSNMIQRIEFLSDIYDSKSKNRTFFFFNTTQRIEHFLHVIHVFKWFKDFLGKISQRIDFSYDSKNGTWRKDLKFMFLKLDSKNWTFFFDDSQTWSFFFFQKLWRKELNLLYDSKNWIFFVWRKELNFFFLICSQELSFFFSF